MMSLSVNMIIEEAIVLLNQQGIDGLTMRELAHKLNVKAASLYWHIKNKDELFALVAEAICDRIMIDEQSNYTRTYVIRILSDYRNHLLEVRDSEKIFAQIPPQTPVRKKLIKTMLHSLETMDVPKDKLIQVGNLLNNYVLSFVADEAMLKRTETISDEYFFGLPHNLDFDSQFRFGLELLLNGIQHTK